MTRAPKPKQPACVAGLPHHWVIASDRCEAGFYPGRCRNCSSEREFWGDEPDDRHFYAVYQTPKTAEVGGYLSRTKRAPSDPDALGRPTLDD